VRALILWKQWPAVWAIEMPLVFPKALKSWWAFHPRSFVSNSVSRWLQACASHEFISVGAVKKAQGAFNALGPGGFIVLAAWLNMKGQVFKMLKSLQLKGSSKVFGILEH